MNKKDLTRFELSSALRRTRFEDTGLTLVEIATIIEEELGDGAATLADILLLPKLQ